MSEINVSKRLYTVAMMVSEGARLADIGTDHGFVPILLIQKKRIKEAIAMDIGKGPLERAKEHVSAVGLSDKITLRLSDGMKELKKGEADTVVIAGMGGGLIIKILSESDPRAIGIKELVLAPQSELYKVRKFLFEEGFDVDYEEMVYEDGKFYPIIHIRGFLDKRQSTGTDKEKVFYLYGRDLIKKNHPVLIEYLEKEKNILSGIKNELERKNRENSESGDSDRLKTRLHEVACDYRLNQMALSMMGR